MKQFNLDEYLKNPSRKVVTRDGRNVTILCTNFMFPHGCQPIVAEIEGEGNSVSFTEKGNYYNDYKLSKNDLFFAPIKHEGWVNVYRVTDAEIMSFGGVVYASREEAEKVGKLENYYVATAKIEWEE